MVNPRLAMALVLVAACTPAPAPEHAAPAQTPPFQGHMARPPQLAQPPWALPIRVAPDPASAAVVTMESKRPPQLRVTLVSAPHGADAKLSIQLKAANGVAAWACERSAPFDQGRIADWCPVVEPWNSGAGDYAVELSYRASKNAPEQATRQPVPFALDDIALEVHVALSETGPPQLRVRRVRPAHRAVTLLRTWTPWHPDRPLRYTLVNGTTGETLHAPGMQGIVFGTLQREVNGAMVPHTRGLLCGHEHPPTALKPGASASIEEGHLVGPMRPFVAGSYRFALRYTTTEPAPEQTQSALEHVYELRDDFRVDPISLQPSFPVGESSSCDPPYTIDREGVRHVKPQCLGY